MRLSHILRSLVSGLCVYVLAAACAATEHHASLADGGAGGGAGGTPAGGLRDAIADVVSDVVDELGNPVPDAKAGPTPADVATEPCTTVLKYGGEDTYFAVHSYPGKTRTDLATLHTIAESSLLAGYTDILYPRTWVRDGSAAAFCGAVSAGPTSIKVTFVLP